MFIEGLTFNGNPDILSGGRNAVSQRVRLDTMSLSSNLASPIAIFAAILVALSVGLLVGAKHPFGNAPAVNKTSYQHEMDAYCTAKLNESLSKLSSEAKKVQTDEVFSA